MFVYIIIFLITIFLSIFETNISYVTIGGRKVATSKISFVIIFSSILLLGICRNEYLGVDTLNYKIYYWDVFKNLDFVSVIQRDSDFGYGLINWIIAKFTNDYWAFRSIVFVLTFSIIGVWIYKHSKNIALSFLCFIAFGILSFDFTILRQALAVSITACSFDFLINRKPVKFFLIVLLAACFHKTALIMLLIYPLLDKKIEKSRFVIKVVYYLVAISVAAIGGQIITRIYQRQDYSEYVVRGEGYSLLVFLLMLIGILYFFSNRKQPNCKIQSELELLNPIICFQIIATGFSLFTRVLYYVTTYLCVTIPDIMEELDDETKNTMLAIILVLLSVLFYVTYYGSDIIPYYTHWMSM